MVWRIMVPEEALVVLMQGYQSHEQTNLVMIPVNPPGSFSAEQFNQSINIYFEG